MACSSEHVSLNWTNNTGVGTVWALPVKRQAFRFICFFERDGNDEENFFTANINCVWCESNNHGSAYSAPPLNQDSPDIIPITHQLHVKTHFILFSLQQTRSRFLFAEDLLRFFFLDNFSIRIHHIAERFAHESLSISNRADVYAKRKFIFG